MSHVCPWWGGFFLDNPLRRLLHSPEKIVGPYVRPGMFVMDVGCGMGLFSIAMAKMVGDQGRVIAVDLQQEMLDVLRRRANKPGGKLLVAEPKIHVPGKKFANEVATAEKTGLRPAETPRVHGCRAVVFEKACR